MKKVAFAKGVSPWTFYSVEVEDSVAEDRNKLKEFAKEYTAVEEVNILWVDEAV